jgi:hypothetical protein
MKNLTTIVQCLIFTFSTSLFAVETNNNTTEPPTPTESDQVTEALVTKVDSGEESDILNNLGDFSFAPALFLISYDDEVLQDSKDVKIRTDGKLSASGSNYSTSIGLEVHYNLSFGEKCKNSYSKKKTKLLPDMRECEEAEKYDFVSGHTLSPYVGLYDFSNGINGLTIGAVYGYWKVDSSTKKASSLNIGLGWTVHKDRLVLADGFKEGQTLDPTMNVDDLTERKDVKGLTLMISAYIGF